MTTSINTILKNRKNRKNKKGFSLVELIVVLVIMAILAAALVPTLIGYIRQSRQSNSKNEAAQCLSAAQTIVSSAFADPDGKYRNQSDGGDVEFVFATNGDVTGITGDFAGVVEALAEVADGSVTIDKDDIEGGVVVSFEYKAENGDKVSYTKDGGYSVS